MELKPTKTEQQKKKLIYGATGGVLVASLIGGSILGASADKEPDNVTNLDPTDSSSQETKVESNTAKKDAASIAKESTQDKTTESQTSSDSKPTTSNEKSTTSNESSNDTVVEQPSAPTTSKDEPVYEFPSSSNTSSYGTYTPSYEEPSAPSSSYTSPTYEEPSTPSTPSYSSNDSIEYTKEDAGRTNKAVSDWNTQNGFGGDNSDSKGDGFLGW